MEVRQKKNISLPEIKQDFSSFNKKRVIRSEIIEQSRDTIEINLKNLNYKAERFCKLKNIFLLSTTFLIYINTLPRIVLIDLGLACILLFLCFQTFKLIKKDSVYFYGGLALRMETTYFCNLKSSLVIPTEYIFDVVINEVIDNLCVKYILIIRTKKEVYKQKPIIPILRGLEPNVQCLEVVYKKLRDKILYKELPTNRK